MGQLCNRSPMHEYVAKHHLQTVWIRGAWLGKEQVGTIFIACILDHVRRFNTLIGPSVKLSDELTR